jgi:colicin import membrane protein
MNEILDRDLIALPLPQDALTVFTTDGAIKPYLARIREAIDAFEGDASTEEGRKAIKSMAFKVAKAKTALEAEGKRLADEQKEIPKKIDATRKLIKDTLDAWRDEVRKPVDEYEAAEEARENAIKAKLAKLQAPLDDRDVHHSQYLRDWLGDIRAVETTEAAFAHFAGAAAELKADAIAVLEMRIGEAEKHEAEQAELEALRAEKAERDKRDREAAIKAEGEREAAAKADAAIKAAQAAAEDAERRAQEAAAKAQRDLDAKAAAEKAEAEKREANKKHRAKINNEALAALVAAGITEDVAKSVVMLIASKAVPHVSISY